MKIIITPRTDDVHACLEGHPEIWACGTTSDAAVVELIRNNPDKFNITMELA